MKLRVVELRWTEAALTSLLCWVALGKTNTRLIAICEFHAGSFKGALDYVERLTSRLAYPGLQLMDGHDPYARALRKFVLTPSE
jgi:hypothetical protein